MLGRRINNWIASGLVGVLTLLFILEEWLWDGLKWVTALIGRLPVLRRLERWIRGLPPRWAAVLFVTPSGLVIPVKLYGVDMIAKGHLLGGAGVFIAGKIVATALFARIYVLTRPTLMQVHWFERLHATILRWRVWAHAQIQAHPLWRAARNRVLRWRAQIEARSGRGGTRWARRFKAAQRLERMRRRATNASAG